MHIEVADGVVVALDADAVAGSNGGRAAVAAVAIVIDVLDLEVGDRDVVAVKLEQAGVVADNHCRAVDHRRLARIGGHSDRRCRRTGGVDRDRFCIGAGHGVERVAGNQLGHGILQCLPRQCLCAGVGITAGRRNEESGRCQGCARRSGLDLTPLRFLARSGWRGGRGCQCADHILHLAAQHGRGGRVIDTHQRGLGRCQGGDAAIGRHTALGELFGEGSGKGYAVGDGLSVGILRSLATECCGHEVDRQACGAGAGSGELGAPAVGFALTRGALQDVLEHLVDQLRAGDVAVQAIRFRGAAQLIDHLFELGVARIGGVE